MRGTTKQRLESYRKKAAESKNPYYKDWRKFVYPIWNTPINTRDEKGRVFSYSLDQIGTNLGDAHELVKSMRHTGWYADSFQESLIKGVVCKMHTARGTYYVPATYCTGWDRTIHYLGDAILVPKGSEKYEHEEAIRDAAMFADSRAEWQAEETREFDARDQAEQQIEEKRQEIHELNRETLALIKEVKQARKQFSPAVCKAIQDKIEDALRERRRAFRRISDLEEDFWEAVCQ